MLFSTLTLYLGYLKNKQKKDIYIKKMKTCLVSKKERDFATLLFRFLLMLRLSR